MEGSGGERSGRGVVLKTKFKQFHNGCKCDMGISVC